MYYNFRRRKKNCRSVWAHRSEHCRRMCCAHQRALRLLFYLFLILGYSFCAKKYRHYHPRRYNLTLSVRNHNVTTAKFFRLNGVGNTADFFVSPGDVFTRTYEVSYCITIFNQLQTLHCLTYFFSVTVDFTRTVVSMKHLI